jgi:hypothetical protein
LEFNELWRAKHNECEEQVWGPQQKGAQLERGYPGISTLWQERGDR